MGKDLIGDLSIGLRAIDWFAWLNQWRMKRNLNNNVSRSLDQLPKAFKRLSLCVSWNERDSFCASVTIAKNKNVSQLCSLFSLTSVWMNLTISNQIKASLLSRRQSAAFIKTSTTTVHNPTIGCVGAGNTGEISTSLIFCMSHTTISVICHMGATSRMPLRKGYIPKCALLSTFVGMVRSGPSLRERAVNAILFSRN